MGQYGSCDLNMQITRKLKKDSSKDGSSDDDSSADDWKQFDEEMKQLQSNIDHCSAWEKYNYNSMSGSGLYCGKDGQNYKCTSPTAGLSGISYGTCSQNMQIS